MITCEHPGNIPVLLVIVNISHYIKWNSMVISKLIKPSEVTNFELFQIGESRTGYPSQYFWVLHSNFEEGKIVQKYVLS